MDLAIDSITYDVIVSVNDCSVLVKTRLGQCVSFLKEINLQFVFKTSFTSNASGDILCNDLAQKCHINMKKALKCNESSFEWVPRSLKSFVLNDVKSFKSQTRTQQLKMIVAAVSNQGKVTVIEHKQHCGVGYIWKEYRWNVCDNNNNKSKRNNSNKFKLQLLVLPDIDEQILYFYCISKMPFYNYSFTKSRCAKDVSVVKSMKTPQRGVLKLIEPDSIEWNNFDMGIYMYSCLRSQLFFGENVKMLRQCIFCLFRCIIDHLFDVIDILKREKESNENNHENDNITIGSQLEIYKLIEIIDYLMHHFLFYIFPLFQIQITEYELVNWILQNWTNCYYLDHKIHPNLNNITLQIYQPNSYIVSIFDKVLAWYQNTEITFSRKHRYIMARYFRSPAPPTFPAQVMASNLSQMNQLCYFLASKDSNYSFVDITSYLHFFVKRFTNENKKMPRDVSVRYCTGKNMSHTFFREDMYRYAQAIKAILSLIIIVLSFYKNFSYHGIRKIGLILDTMDKKYIKYTQMLYSRATTVKKDRLEKNMILYFIALVIYKLKTLRIVKSGNINISQKQLERKLVTVLLTQVSFAHDMYNQTKDSISIWNEWPQIHDYMKWIHFLSNKSYNNNNNNLNCTFNDTALITKLRDLPQRFKIVYQQCSIFAQATHKSKYSYRDTNRLDIDEMCTKLGFGGYKAPQKGRYRKMLRLCRNVSRQTECGNDKCCGVIRRLRRCRNCKHAFYCSRRCQKMDWEKHSRKCTINRMIVSCV